MYIVNYAINTSFIVYFDEDIKTFWTLQQFLFTVLKVLCSWPVIALLNKKYTWFMKHWQIQAAFIFIIK